MRDLNKLSNDYWKKTSSINVTFSWDTPNSERGVSYDENGKVIRRLGDDYHVAETVTAFIKGWNYKRKPLKVSGNLSKVKPLLVEAGFPVEERETWKQEPYLYIFEYTPGISGGY